MKTLAERFCERHGIPSVSFEEAMLRLCLYPQARVLRNFLHFRQADYFEPDLELVRAAGRLTSAAALPAEIAEYHYHPDNSGRLRREWRLRLSVTRLQKIVNELLQPEAVPGADGGSYAPFDHAQGDVATSPKTIELAH